MKIRLLAALAVVTLAASPAAAQGTRYQDGGGRAWDAIRSESGLVLATRGATIHLSRDCKAVSARYGDGRWEWANGGFAIVFGEQRIGFASQEIDVGQGQACRA